MDLWTSLEAEWAHLASSRDGPATIRAWKLSAPGLAGFESPKEVVATIGRIGDAPRSSALLADLLLLASTDAVAAQATLTAVIPGLRGVARRRWWATRADSPWSDRSELDADTLAAGWEAIHAHAGRRHERPAAVIVRAAEGRLRRAYDAHRSRRSRYPPVADLPEGGSQSGADAARSAEEQLTALIASAVTAGVLDGPGAATIFAVAVLGFPAAHAGRVLGVRPGAVYRILARARVGLTTSTPVAAIPSPRPIRRPGPSAPTVADNDLSRSLDPNPDGESRPNPEEGVPMPPLLLTVSQAAEMLGIGRTMVYDLMSTGELESCKLAKKCRRIPYESALDYVRRLRQDGADRSGTPVAGATAVGASSAPSAPGRGPRRTETGSAPSHGRPSLGNRRGGVGG